MKDKVTMVTILIRLFKNKDHKFYSYYLLNPHFFFFLSGLLFCKGKALLLESERIVGIAGVLSLSPSLSSAFSILSQNRDADSAILVQGQVLNISCFCLCAVIFLMPFNI